VLGREKGEEAESKVPSPPSLQASCLCGSAPCILCSCCPCSHNSTLSRLFFTVFLFLGVLVCVIMLSPGVESQLYKVSCPRDLAKAQLPGGPADQEVGRTGRVWSESQMKTSGPLRMKPPPCSPKPTSPLAPFAHPTPILAPSLAVSPPIHKGTLLSITREPGDSF